MNGLDHVSAIFRTLSQAHLVQLGLIVFVLEKPWGTNYRLKAYPIDPRQQFHFITDLAVRGKAALIEMGVVFAAIPAVSQAPS